jgi:hypothetical protein
MRSDPNPPAFQQSEIKIINWYLSKFLLDSNRFFSLFFGPGSSFGLGEAPWPLKFSSDGSSLKRE